PVLVSFGADPGVPVLLNIDPTVRVVLHCVVSDKVAVRRLLYHDTVVVVTTDRVLRDTISRGVFLQINPRFLITLSGVVYDTIPTAGTFHSDPGAPVAVGLVAIDSVAVGVTVEGDHIIAVIVHEVGL